MTKKAYFEQMTRKGFVNSKSIWNTVKPFLTNKEKYNTCENMTIENKGKLISDNLKLTKIFIYITLTLLKTHQVFLLVLQGNLIARQKILTQSKT